MSKGDLYTLDRAEIKGLMLNKGWDERDVPTPEAKARRAQNEAPEAPRPQPPKPAPRHRRTRPQKEPRGIDVTNKTRGIDKMYSLEHEGGPLSEEDRRILQALVAYPTKTAAAKALGISRSTIYYKLRDEDLREAYEQMRSQAMADATDSLMSVAESAVMVLHEVANDTNVSPQTRVQAAGKLLDLALRAHELTDVVARIAALEEELG